MVTFSELLDRRDRIVAVDIETTGLDYINDQIVSVAFASENSEECVDACPIKIREKINSFSDDTFFVFHNSSFDLKFLEKIGISFNNKIIDTLHLAALSDENRPLGLKDLSIQYFGENSLSAYNKILDWLPEKKKSIKYVSLAPKELLEQYNIEDVRNTRNLFFVLAEEIIKKDKILLSIAPKTLVAKTSEDFYWEELNALEPILRDMEYAGIKLDLNKMQSESERLSKELLDDYAKINELAKNEISKILALRDVKKQKFNWRSTKDLKILLYAYYNIDSHIGGKRMTPKGELCCDISVIQDALTSKNLKDSHREVLETLIKIRDKEKNLNTYIAGILKCSINGRVHSNYRQIGGGGVREARGTKTGRLSSANPNMQNIPSYAKDFFIPDNENSVFIHFDYSQVELRVAAHLSRDPIMCDAFNSKKDLHKILAQEIFKKSEISKEERQVGKTCNFLLIYDGSPQRLQQEIKNLTGIEYSIEECSEFRDRFFARFAQYGRYLKFQKEFLIKNKAVISYFGRVRRLPDIRYINSLDYRKRCVINHPELNYDETRKSVNHALKQGYNHPIQSFAASIMKRAMIELYDAGYDIRNQVHDSITIHYKREGSSEAMSKIQNILENVIKLSVPLVCEGKILNSFSE